MEMRMKPGDIVRHFKGNEYEILHIAKDSETMEDVIVYRARYGEGGVWVRPLGMFFSPVDREKYPDVKQKYRFEKIEKGEKVE
ncbi:MAG: DUF1653 domain-containing protein [Clostridia bacterium]|nr:DUF1653 domain-containing protein [Clostridia bacterium]MBQ2947716.1 DUF1653 domain-containing protein [Clostridia bacterium]MBQ4608222.1 DUF1653 domain-containing protein [Clostridia bacterium]MBQ6859448.1 DUF1653 domain-containing protein [Clostridia bacterium]MBQ7053058.1 DUF1653 domain-containing protein [Clostridia bacterium]